MKPRVILHIGPHKTGSTSFQSCLIQNKQALLQQGFGIYNPLNGSINSVELFGCIRDQNVGRRKKIKENIRQQLSAANTQYKIFSAESLALLRSPDELGALRELFPHDTIFQVLAVKREIEAWRRSASTLTTKNEDQSNREPGQFIEKLTDWDAIMTAWTDFADELTVIEYADQGLIENMLQALGIDTTKLQTSQRQNDSRLRKALPRISRFYGKHLSKRWPGKVKRKLFNGGDIR